MNRLLLLGLTYLCMSCSATPLLSEPTGDSDSIEALIQRLRTEVELPFATEPLQVFNDSFDVMPPSGPIYTQEVAIYKLGPTLCALTTFIVTDSLLYSYEDIIFIRDGKFSQGMHRSFFTLADPREDGTHIIKDKYHLNEIQQDAKTQAQLKVDLDKYKIQLNTAAQSSCL